MHKLRKNYASRVLQTASCYTIAEARTEGDFLAAFRLVYRAYAIAGLTKPNRLKLRILPHQLYPTSRILIAKCEERVVATITIVHDGPLGLPMEQTFSDCAALVRSRYLNLAELTCMAVEPDRTKCPEPLRSLLDHGLRYGIVSRTQAAVISVHPRRAPFFRRRFGFRNLSGTRRCPRVCAPAVAQMLQLDLPETPCDTPLSLADFRLGTDTQRLRWFGKYVCELEPAAANLLERAAA